jgi:hypothetical protein
MSARLLPDGLDTLGQSSISHRPCRRCTADTVIAGGHRFADYGELRRNPEGVSDLRSRLLLADENWLSPGVYQINGLRHEVLSVRVEVRDLCLLPVAAGLPRAAPPLPCPPES